MHIVNVVKKVVSFWEIWSNNGHIIECEPYTQESLAYIETGTNS